MSIKDKYAIVGLGITRQGKLPGLSINAVRAEAARLAIEDAGLKVQDVNGFIYQVGMEEMFNNDLSAGDVPKRLGMRPNFIWNMEAAGNTCVASILAAGAAVEAGTADYVVCVYGSCDRSHPLIMARGEGDYRNTDHAYGMFSPAANHAMSVRRHMHEYGTTHEQLGAIAVTQRENANKRPDAIMYKIKMTLTDYLNSEWLVEPYRKFDCCLVNDGGIAFVVTTAERAKDLKAVPVYVMGAGFGQQVKLVYDKQNFTHLGVASSKAAAFKTAGISLADIDVVEFYDCFTGTVLFQTEDYGFCKKGEGGPFWEDGNARLDGPIPINTGGGSLSWGYNQGFTPVAEAVRQLRGDGGETQVKDAEIALASGHGTNTPGIMEYGHSTIILRR
jgi:acetyl-CoA acetyltransferase